MAKDAYWIKLDSNAFNDVKVKALRKHYGWQGFGWYVYLVLNMRDQEQYQLQYDELTFEALSEDMGCSLDQVKQFIDDCIAKYRLFKKTDGFFFSERLCRDMELKDEKREKARESGLIGAEKRWGGKYRNSNSDDPDKYIKGKYGHMVMENQDDLERIHGEQKDIS